MDKEVDWNEKAAKLSNLGMATIAALGMSIDGIKKTLTFMELFQTMIISLNVSDEDIRGIIDSVAQDLESSAKGIRSIESLSVEASGLIENLRSVFGSKKA